MRFLRLAHCWPALLPAFVFPGILSGCDRALQPSAESGSSTNAASAVAAMPRDDLGRDLKLTRIPQRIVTIGPGATETVWALGAGKTVVGRDSGSDYPVQAKSIPIVADFRGPFFEKVVAARPDLIIVQGETWDAERIEGWQQKCGAPVAALTPVTLEQVAGGIDKIGAWLDRRTEAKTLADTLQKGFQSADATPPSAFLEVQRAPLWAAGRDTLIDDVMRRAGLSNAARSIKGYKQFSAERLLADAPDFYIVTDKPANRARVVAELKKHPVLGRLKCVRQNRVLVVDGDLVLRPGPRLSEGIAQLAEQAGSVVKKQALPNMTPVP